MYGELGLLHPQHKPAHMADAEEEGQGRGGRPDEARDSGMEDNGSEGADMVNSTAVIAMYAANDERARQRLERNKPKNTQRAYKGPIKEWREFCGPEPEGWGFRDGDEVTERKLCEFLEQRVIYRRKKV